MHVYLFLDMMVRIITYKSPGPVKDPPKKVIKLLDEGRTATAPKAPNKPIFPLKRGGNGLLTVICKVSPQNYNHRRIMSSKSSVE